MYKYESLLNNGMIKLKISRHQLEQNGMAKCGSKLFSRIDVYVGDDFYIVEHRVNLLGKITMVLLFPIHILMVGVKEAYNETLRTLFESKYGSFSCDKVYRNRTSKLSEFIYSIYDNVRGGK